VWLSGSGEFRALPVTGETIDITVLTNSNGFVLIPERITTLAKGQQVKISFLPGLSFTSGNPTDYLKGSENISSR
jgi:molybdopterin biosynthesis enzyme